MLNTNTMVQEVIEKFNSFDKTPETIAHIAFEGYELDVVSHTPATTVLLNEYMDDDCGCYYENEYTLSDAELNYYILTDFIHNVLVKENTKLIDTELEIQKMLFTERAFLLTNGDTMEFEKVYSYIRAAVEKEISVEVKEHEMNLFSKE
jgi:hypothetical protein